MEVNKKEMLAVGAGVLAAVGIGIGIWWFFGRTGASVSLINGPETATTTPSEATMAHIEENAAYYDIHAHYPSTAPLPGNTGAEGVAEMKTFVQNTILRFKESGNFANLTAEDIKIQGLGPDRKYALDINYEVYKGGRSISYVYLIEADTLGAHPNTYYRTFTYDTRTGASLALDDLFAPGAPYLDRLSAQTRADLPNLLGGGSAGDPPVEGSDAFPEITAGTQPEEDSFQNFAIDGTMLRIIFPPYQVGPYSLGTVVDPIPLSTFASILKAEYRP